LTSRLIGLLELAGRLGFERRDQQTEAQIGSAA
jgi:hypothetical protein